MVSTRVVDTGSNAVPVQRSSSAPLPLKSISYRAAPVSSSAEYMSCTVNPARLATWIPIVIERLSFATRTPDEKSGAAPLSPVVSVNGVGAAPAGATTSASPAATRAIQRLMTKIVSPCANPAVIGELLSSNGCLGADAAAARVDRRAAALLRRDDGGLALPLSAPDGLGGRARGRAGRSPRRQRPAHAERQGSDPFGVRPRTQGNSRRAPLERAG